MKVFIAIPCMDTLSAKFAQCLVNLVNHKRDFDVEVGFHIGSLVYDSRNKLAERAINSDADYVLWLDSDMTFVPDTLDMMLDTLKTNNYEVLTGMYFRRRPPFTPTLFEELRILPTGTVTKEFDDIPDAIFEVAGCGFGCVLMSRNVLWNVFCQNGNMFSPINGVGEDLSFCWRARRCGHKIYCDPTIALGHEIRTTITKSNRGIFYGNAFTTQATS